MLINCDFKQIEVGVLAQLSKDKAFIQLLNDGTDVYKYFAAIMYDLSENEITEAQRDSLKIPILGISYGKGYIKLARETNKSEDWCKEFINNFYEQFPEVKQLHKRWIYEVKVTGQLCMFDGLRLVFKKYPKSWSEDYNCWFNEGYNPAEVKNWPVQHTAFVILATYLAAFLRQKALFKRDKYLLINTVHDSIMIDCRNQFVEECVDDLKEILAKLPDILYNKYQEEFIVPINAKITVGNSWYDL